MFYHIYCTLLSMGLHHLKKLMEMFLLHQMRKKSTDEFDCSVYINLNKRRNEIVHLKEVKFKTSASNV